MIQPFFCLSTFNLSSTDKRRKLIRFVWLFQLFNFLQWRLENCKKSFFKTRKRRTVKVMRNFLRSDFSPGAGENRDDTELPIGRDVCSENALPMAMPFEMS